MGDGHRHPSRRLTRGSRVAVRSAHRNGACRNHDGDAYDEGSGWAVPWSPTDGLSGGVLVGGTQVTSAFPSGAIVGVFTWEPPPGLASRVTTCRIEGPIEPTPFKVLIAPAHVFFPTTP